ncbi:uncharacterized protein LOC135705315 [Ochlerotatus camptorhynchus]|uniref:uncharacterized protein LOC135705315 n=1 Tax=Ochlerotatus camptorhynchus TaxID=644619 RepID=UPI0031DFC4EE
MAKGARKKTKWVSLSLASATSTVPPAEHDAASKLSRGTKKAILEDVNGVNVDKASCPENIDSKDVSTLHSSDRRSSWNNTNGYARQQTTEGSIGQPYSNGYHSHPSRNYSSQFKSHYNRNSYYHNGSSRKPHYNSYNGNGSYRNNSNDQYTAEVKNEQNGAVIINEDEYTKITTPRQDVLFKKGYLSRPKKHTTSSTNGNDNGAATGSSSVNGTTDGSDVATASGSVSTAESVTSDSAYLTDGHLLDYPAPLPYFGYIDQSGVLVMNGFAVDNSGFPYMNGGQTYIYPTNYHCQSSFNEDVDGGELAASDDDKNQSNDTFDDVEVVEAVPVTLQENAEVCLLNQTRLNSISEENGQDVVNGEVDIADLNQQVPQQPILSPFANSFDYAQFYNAFYYPGCMVAPFPVVGNEMYCDQFGGMSEEEHARQQSFRKRKKRYRNWDEYPAEFFPDGTIDTMYQYPNVLCIPETEVTDSTEVPVDGIISNPTSTDQAVPTQPSTTAENTDIAGHNSTNELPSSQQSDINSASLRPSKSLNAPKLAERSQHLNTVSKAPGRQRSHAQKNRKKDLIESTRAFAEQNIDLTRPASLLRPPDVQQSESSEWRTVRNGKEVTIEEDRELRSVGTKNLSNVVLESPSNVKLFYDECKQEPSVASCDSTTAVSEETKRPKKETIGRKGKKTAKGKGKKSKKIGLSQKGFELIEPEFPVSEISNESELVESTDAADEAVPPNENAVKEDVGDSEHEIIEAEQEGVLSSISNEQVTAGCALNLENDEDYDVECLEEDLRDIQFSDLQIETVDHVANQQEKVIDAIGKQCETLNIPDDSIVQVISQNNPEHIDTTKKDEPHEVPSELIEESKLSSLTATCIQACAEDMDIIENKLTENCNLPFNPTELSSPDKTVQYEHEDDDDQQKCKHFSNDEYFENFDSGVQSPAAFTSSSSDSKERKSSTSSFGSQEIQLTEAVTKWLSETLSNKRLEELFVLPEDPILLHRIHQFNFLNFDDSLVLSSDTYSSSSCDEAEDSVDSDYMSDVQAKNQEVNGLDGQQKTEPKKDQLAKQTANGHCLANGGGHSNHKQKRCIIM